MFRKYEKNGYIICLGAGEEISEEEYSIIIEKINNRPLAPKGYTYRLNSALEWEIEPIKLTDDIKEENELESEAENE